MGFFEPEASCGLAGLTENDDLVIHACAQGIRARRSSRWVPATRRAARGAASQVGGSDRSGPQSAPVDRHCSRSSKRSHSKARCQRAVLGETATVDRLLRAKQQLKLRRSRPPETGRALCAN
jgi:hypothetical protein